MASSGLKWTCLSAITAKFPLILPLSVLSFNERVIIDDNLSDVDIIKVVLEKGKVINCEVILYEVWFRRKS